jgi:uncharacterized damage-inducible protein DinB
MTQLDSHSRPAPPVAADEPDTLLGFLDFQRATLAWKTHGLDSAGLNATVAASTITLGGLLKHMAYVEDYWFSYFLHGQEPLPPWSGADWAADRDWEWHSAAHDTPEQLRTIWTDAVANSRQLVAQILADADMGAAARRTEPDGQAPSLRWIVCHMIEEYARHNGHADLIRESIDGETGE